MVLDGNSIVVPAGGFLVRVDLATWTVTTLAGDANLVVAKALAANATNFYFFATIDQSPQALFAYPRAGGAVSKIADAPQAAGTQSWGTLGVDGSNAYWVEAPLPAIGPAKLMKAPLTGGQPTVLAQPALASGGVAVDATNVYFTTVSPSPSAQTPSGGGLWALPLVGGPPAWLSSKLSIPMAVVSTGEAVLVADWGKTSTDCGTQGGRIVEIPLSAGPQHVLAAELENVRGIALGNGNAYFAWDSGCVGVGLGQLMKVPLAGGPRTPLTNTAGWAYDSIVVDTSVPASGKVYFAFLQGGAMITNGIAEADE
jgi:hypothetical protein